MFSMVFFFHILGPLCFLLCPETNMNSVIIVQPFYNEQAKDNLKKAI